MRNKLLIVIVLFTLITTQINTASACSRIGPEFMEETVNISIYDKNANFLYDYKLDDMTLGGDCSPSNEIRKLSGNDIFVRDSYSKQLILKIGDEISIQIEIEREHAEVVIYYENGNLYKVNRYHHENGVNISKISPEGQITVKSYDFQAILTDYVLQNLSISDEDYNAFYAFEYGSGNLMYQVTIQYLDNNNQFTNTNAILWFDILSENYEIYPLHFSLFDYYDIDGKNLLLSNDTHILSYNSETNQTQAYRTHKQVGWGLGTEFDSNYLYYRVYDVGYPMNISRIDRITGEITHFDYTHPVYTFAVTDNYLIFLVQGPDVPNLLTFSIIGLFAIPTIIIKGIKKFKK